MRASSTPAPIVVAERYEVVRCLGAGTQAHVFLVFDHEEGRSLALKTTASPHDDLQAWDLLREANLMGRLAHPCVVQLLDLLEVAGGPALLLELAPGGSVREWMERFGILSAGAALGVSLECASALEHAHRNAVVHRDVKPGNLVIRADGSVALADFGIASCALRPRRSAPGVVMGSPGFMAPEQRGGRGTVDARADVYGLGATLYRMCTGRRVKRLYRFIDEPQLLDPLPELVAALVAGCCRFDPAERFQTMSEVRDRIDAAVARLPPPERGIAGLCDPRGASRARVPRNSAPVDQLRRRLEAHRGPTLTPAPMPVRRRAASPSPVALRRSPPPSRGASGAHRT
jgi:eukaryotic-like serine/threonine-protein kinase